MVGGAAETTVAFADAASLSGTLSSAGGLTLDYSAYTTGLTVNLATGEATGTGGVSDVVAVVGGAGANITLFSYMDDLGIAVTTDRAAVPDPEVFVECLEQGMAEVLATS